MLIDRDDRTINLCEIRYSQGEYEILEAYDRTLREKLSIFQRITKTKKRSIIIDDNILWFET